MTPAPATQVLLPKEQAFVGLLAVLAPPAPIPIEAYLERVAEWLMKQGPARVNDASVQLSPAQETAVWLRVALQNRVTEQLHRSTELVTTGAVQAHRWAVEIVRSRVAELEASAEERETGFRRLHEARTIAGMLEVLPDGPRQVPPKAGPPPAKRSRKRAPAAAPPAEEVPPAA